MRRQARQKCQQRSRAAANARHARVPKAVQEELPRAERMRCR
jgi:hypothetical protein